MNSRRDKFQSKWSISQESAWLKQTAMSFGSNVTRITPRAQCLLCSWGYNNTMLPARDSWQVNTAHVSSFVLISMLRGQPRTPPSGENLGALDYHLKVNPYIGYSYPEFSRLIHLVAVGCKVDPVCVSIQAILFVYWCSCYWPFRVTVPHNSKNMPSNWWIHRSRFLACIRRVSRPDLYQWIMYMFD